jgi:hypothetical protein
MRIIQNPDDIMKTHHSVIKYFQKVLQNYGGIMGQKELVVALLS